MRVVIGSGIKAGGVGLEGEGEDGGVGGEDEVGHVEHDGKVDEEGEPAGELEVEEFGLFGGGIGEAAGGFVEVAGFLADPEGLAEGGRQAGGEAVGEGLAVANGVDGGTEPGGEKGVAGDIGGALGDFGGGDAGHEEQVESAAVAGEALMEQGAAEERDFKHQRVEGKTDEAGVGDQAGEKQDEKERDIKQGEDGDGAGKVSEQVDAAHKVQGQGTEQRGGVDEKGGIDQTGGHAAVGAEVEFVPDGEVGQGFAEQAGAFAGLDGEDVKAGEGAGVMGEGVGEGVAGGDILFDPFEEGFLAAGGDGVEGAKERDAGVEEGGEVVKQGGEVFFSHGPGSQGWFTDKV